MGDDWLNDIKTRFKKNPSVYKLFVDILAPVKINDKKNFRMIYKYLNTPDRPIIVNIGSGPFSLGPDMINVDMAAYKNIHMLADIHHLPFKEGSVDGVVSVAVLEHVKDPGMIINEAGRILKKGGCIYTIIPFVVGFHAAPDDYHRYTSSGTIYLHKGFKCVETGVYGGPTSGFLWVFEEWLAMLFSFGNRGLYKILYIFFMGILWPIKFLDFLLVKHPMAANIASTFYYLGRKE